MVNEDYKAYKTIMTSIRYHQNKNIDLDIKTLWQSYDPSMNYSTFQIWVSFILHEERISGFIVGDYIYWNDPNIDGFHHFYPDERGDIN